MVIQIIYQNKHGLYFTSPIIIDMVIFETFHFKKKILFDCNCNKSSQSSSAELFFILTLSFNVHLNNWIISMCLYS